MCVCDYYSILYCYHFGPLVTLFLDDIFLEVVLPGQRTYTLKCLLVTTTSFPKHGAISTPTHREGAHQMLSIFPLVCQSDGQSWVTCFNLHFPTTFSTRSYRPLNPCQSDGWKRASGFMGISLLTEMKHVFLFSQPFAFPLCGLPLRVS